MKYLNNQPLLFLEQLTAVTHDCLNNADEKVDDCLIYKETDLMYLQFGREYFEFNILPFSQTDFSSPSGNWKWDPEKEGYFHVTGPDATTAPLIPTDEGPILPYLNKELILIIKLTKRTAGSLRLESNGAFLAYIDDTVQEYLIVLSDTEFHLIPSIDYDGTILSVELHELETFADGDIYIQDMVPGVSGLEPGSTTVPLDSHIQYSLKHINLWWFLQEVAGSPLASGCYRIELQAPGSSGHSPINHSNCFKVSSDVGCNLLVQGYSDCNAFEFDFSMNFRLLMRVPLKIFNPEYDMVNPLNRTAEGVHNRISAERTKRYTAALEDQSEYVHDVMSCILLNDHFTINNVPYHFVGKTYDQVQDKKGASTKWNAIFDIAKEKDTIYNNHCCGPDGNLIEETHLCVYGGWTGESYKEIDGFDVPDGTSLTFTLISYILNDKELLETPNVLAFNKAASYGWVPDLLISEGVNGNAESGGGTFFVQNINDWVNAVPGAEDVTFFDNMSAVYYEGDTTWKVVIELLDSLEGKKKYEYTEQEMKYYAWDETYEVWIIQATLSLLCETV